MTVAPAVTVTDPVEPVTALPVTWCSATPSIVTSPIDAVSSLPDIIMKFSSLPVLANVVAANERTPNIY
jgi:hypothetical protein